MGKPREIPNLSFCLYYKIAIALRMFTVCCNGMTGVQIMIIKFWAVTSMMVTQRKTRLLVWGGGSCDGLGDSTKVTYNLALNKGLSEGGVEKMDILRKMWGEEWRYVLFGWADHPVSPCILCGGL